MFEIIRRNADTTITIKWHGTNIYQTIWADDLRGFQAKYLEFVPEEKTFYGVLSTPITAVS